MSSSRAAGLAARTPLRIKLVALLIGLLVLGLAVTGVAAWATMRNYLLGQIDTTLASQSPGIAGSIDSTVQRVGGDLSLLACPGENPGPERFGTRTNYYFQVSNTSGVLACVPGDGSARSAPAFPATTASQAASERGVQFTVASQDGNQRWRAQVVASPDGTVVFIAYSLDGLENTVRQLVLIEIVGGLIVVLLLGVLGYALVRRSLRPLVEVEQAAEDIAAGDLTRRVPELDPSTEVGRLSRAFNTMLTRIEAAFRAREESEAEAKVSEERMRRFVADASHELRTPLTSIRGFAELYRQGAVPDPADISRIMRRIEDQATRMGLLVEDLLMLARLDQQRPLDLEPVDLLTIAGEAVQDARALEPDRPVELVVPDDGPPPIVLGDGTRLRQVVGNLMSNALTHTPPGTPITISVRTDGGFGELDVADRGPGMSAEDAAHVFERFYRADSSRARTSGGTGLGLSIAAALVAAHSGALTVQTAPGQGATFSLRIPSVPADLPLVLEPTDQ